eukprot:TRINITY_DN6275_c0_g1_i1.p1 TRINITY_DN6275_c0_g1~~TRINITY_DN6275_c0_g1_i1.p1  ORF type:complete len:203 (+),score=45.67 TRINITY_DN6275_c0_g1_i1:28-636(+)
MSWGILIVLVSILVLPLQVTSQNDNDVTALPDWDGTKVLDNEGKVRLFWKIIIPGQIRLRLEVDEHAYIALGFDPEDDKMTNADMVILTKNENIFGFHLGDYFSSGMVKPQLDEDQTIINVVSGQTDGMTFMDFMRPLPALDEEEDKAIGVGDVKVIWGYGASYNLDMHSQKGFTTINFLKGFEDQADNYPPKKDKTTKRFF